MKNLLNILMVSALAVSCINLNGKLNVTSTMSVKKKGGFLHLVTKNVNLEPGSYRADLKINNASSFTLKLRADKADEKDILIPIKSEKPFNLPNNGPVLIKGTEISQPFDLNGTIKTDYTYSDITRTDEDCTISRTERQCDKICTTTVAGQGRRPVVTCDIVCRDVLVTFPGRRYVEYHYRYTHRDLVVAFNDVNNKAQLATFSAIGTESDRINDYYGVCR